MPSLKKIGRIFIMEWNRIIQYRTDAFLWLIAEAAVPLVSLAIWYTVALQSQRGPTPRDVFTYYIFLMFIKILVEAWNGVFMAQEILNGEIVQSLIRPVAVFWKYLANVLLEKIFKLLLPIPLLLVIIATYPQWFSPAIFRPRHITLFLVSLLVAMAVAFLAEMVIGTLAFWLEDVFQIRRYKTLLEEVASGVLIPFAFMPPVIFTIFSFLPFRYMFSAPAEIILGQVEGRSALLLIGTQILWLAVLFTASRLLWSKGLQRYAVPGQ
jgi:ABC-2 type transport system permease protein